jgi:DNA-binding helix-hairpin-helix protein with protein kinase domain
VNQGNVVVSRQATVQLIDCDSFQITHLGRTYPCRVGVPLFTPPELQGQRLAGVARTPDHDRFGLAVLVFHLLFMGRHPFAGRHPERALPIEAAIREGLFAFGQEAADLGWQPPPHSVRLQELSPALARLFEQGFSRDAAAGGPRPAADQWMKALDELETLTEVCAEDPRHVRLRTDGSCPWCRIEREGGPRFFFLPPGTASDAFDLEVTWKAIEAVRSPGPAFLPEPRREEAHRAERCGEVAFRARKKELAEAKIALEGAQALEAREWTELAARFREIGLDFHLKSFALEFARIPGLGRDELSTLALAGVTTAADLDAESLRAIRGLDRALVKGLFLFKEVATRSFTFDPATGIPGRDQRLLAESQAERRDELRKTLQSGAIDLSELRRQILTAREGPDGSV